MLYIKNADINVSGTSSVLISMTTFLSVTRNSCSTSLQSPTARIKGAKLLLSAAMSGMLEQPCNKTKVYIYSRPFYTFIFYSKKLSKLCSYGKLLGKVWL